MRYTTMIGGLVLGALPVMASAHDSCRVRVELPRIGIGCGHHEVCGPVIRGCVPSVYVGPSYTYAPVVVAPEVVYTTPEVVVAPPVVYTTPVYTTPVYIGGGCRVYERSHCVPVRHCR